MSKVTKPLRNRIGNQVPCKILMAAPPGAAVARRLIQALRNSAA
jgi:hypothetical protein